MAVTLLLLALAGILAWIYRLIANDSSPAPLPRRGGHARPAHPVADRRQDRHHTVPPVGPAGTPAAVRQAGDAAGVPLGLPGILNPRLYETGEMPGITQEKADEMWWML